jgi:DNA-binding NtrC family response regulator
MDDSEPESLPVWVGMTLQEMERVLIAATLEQTGWCIKEAASILGIDGSTLYAKISCYGIARSSRSALGGGH